MPSKSNFYLSHSENSSFNRSTLDRTFLCGRFADRILVAEHADEAWLLVSTPLIDNLAPMQAVCHRLQVSHNIQVKGIAQVTEKNYYLIVEQLLSAGSKLLEQESSNTQLALEEMLKRPWR